MLHAPCSSRREDCYGLVEVIYFLAIAVIAGMFACGRAVRRLAVERSGG